MEAMKAIVLEGVNQPLCMKQVPGPELGAGDILMKVKAAALNRRDWWIQQGQYAGLTFPIILGSDGSGVIEAVGPCVSEQWLGKAVVINPSIAWGNREEFQQKDFHILGLPQDGTLAEYVKVPVTNLFEKPAHLSFEEAAALPLGGVTAYRSLFSRARLKRGEKVLITGAGGGVATFALQWAIHSGATVYVTSGSRTKIEKAKELGAVDGVLYTDETWGQQLQELVGGFDVIIDSALGEGFAHLLDLSNPGGRIVFFGGTAGNIPPLNGRKIFWKQLSLLGTTMGSPADFEAMLTFVQKNKLTPVVDSVYPLGDADVALRKLNDASQFGKIVLRA